MILKIKMLHMYNTPMLCISTWMFVDIKAFNIFEKKHLNEFI